MPTSSLPPVPRTHAGRAPRSSAHCRISSWSISGRLLAELRDPLRCDVLRAEALLDARERLVAPDLLDAFRDLVLDDFDLLDAALPRLPELDLELAEREFFLLPVLRPDLDGISDFLPVTCLRWSTLCNRMPASIGRVVQPRWRSNNSAMRSAAVGASSKCNSGSINSSSINVGPGGRSNMSARQ